MWNNEVTNRTYVSNSTRNLSKEEFIFDKNIWVRNHTIWILCLYVGLEKLYEYVVTEFVKSLLKVDFSILAMNLASQTRCRY